LAKTEQFHVHFPWSNVFIILCYKFKAHRTILKTLSGSSPDTELFNNIAPGQPASCVIQYFYIWFTAFPLLTKNHLGISNLDQFNHSLLRPIYSGEVVPWRKVI
jgi:hypothetical protein